MAVFDCDTIPCLASCDAVFVRLRVRPTIAQGTWVEWLLHPTFTEGYTAQLQVGRTGSNLADDWQNVGLPVSNVNYAIDDTQRVFGRTQWTHYRVVLIADSGVYTSKPANCWGDLAFANWRRVMNRERIYRVQFERTIRGQDGYLLKRRLAGDRPEPGKGIIDFQTDEVINAQAVATKGTEYIGGYFAPIPCSIGDPNNLTRGERLDPRRGTVNAGLSTTIMMLAVPQVDSKDVWVAKDSGFRWETGFIKHVEEIDGIPIVISATIKLLPFSNIVYTIPMPS
jgi:hypothetical protein